MRESTPELEAIQSLTRRGFAILSAAALLSAGTGSLLMNSAMAREAEPGDDRGGHGNDDPPGDRHGRHRRRHRRHHL